MSNNESTLFIVGIVLCLMFLTRHYRKMSERKQVEREAARKARLASILLPQPDPKPANRVMELHSMNRGTDNANLRRWGNLKPEPQPKPIDPSYTGERDRRLGAIVLACILLGVGVARGQTPAPADTVRLSRVAGGLVTLTSGKGLVIQARCITIAAHPATTGILTNLDGSPTLEGNDCTTLLEHMGERFPLYTGDMGLFSKPPDAWMFRGGLILFFSGEYHKGELPDIVELHVYQIDAKPEPQPKIVWDAIPDTSALSGGCKGCYAGHSKPKP